MTKWAGGCGIIVLDKESLFVRARPCVGAEIPPAGAPSGFDSAAGRGCAVCLFARCAAPLRMTQRVGCCGGGTILVS